MPKTSKEILAIIASSDIDYVNLDDYLSPNIGQVVYNSEISILHSIFSWTNKHKIERLPLSINLNLSTCPLLNAFVLDITDMVFSFFGVVCFMVL